MTNLILSFDLIDDQFGVIVGFKVLYRHLSGELEAISRALYLATVLEHGSINEKA